MIGWKENSCLSAYWAGFMMADGYFYRRGGSSKKASCIVLQLAEKDSRHVSKFIEFLGTPASAYHLESNGFPATRVDIYKGSEGYMSELEKRFPLRLTPEKSWRFSEIPRGLQMPFLTGFIDGDGSVIWDNNNAKAVQIFGETELFIQEVKHFLNLRYPPIRPNRIKKGVTPLKNGFIFRLQGTRAALMVEEVSKMKLPFLERKWAPKEEAA